MLNTIIMLIIVCVLATVLLLDFAILIPKFGAEHFGLPEDLTKMMMKMPDRPLWVNILDLNATSALNGLLCDSNR